MKVKQFHAGIDKKRKQKADSEKMEEKHFCN